MESDDVDAKAAAAVSKLQDFISSFPARTCTPSPMETFECLGELLELLSTTPPAALQQCKPAVECALKDFCLARTSSNEDPQPVLDRLERSFALLYAHSDSRDMLQIAGDFQDLCKAKTHAVQVEVACLHALSGIAQSRGKALTGHLVDTLALVVDGPSTSTAVAAAAVAKFSYFTSTPSPPATTAAGATADYQTWMIGAVRATRAGLVGAGESGKQNWPTAMRFLSKALAWKKSTEVRIAAVTALKDFANACPSAADKIGHMLIKHLYVETELKIKLAVAEAIAWALTVAGDSGGGSKVWVSTTQTPAKVKFDVVEWKHSLSEILESVVAAFHAETSQANKQSLVQVFVSLIERLPAAGSQEDIALQAQWALQFAANGEVLCAAQALRQGIGAVHGERLQLALARSLVDLCASSASSTAYAKTACSIELCHLIGTLGEAAGTLVANVDDASVLRALCVSVPQLIPTCSEQWSNQLVNGLSNAAQIQRAVDMLSSIVYAAASVNRAGAVSTTNLFGLCKALASRTLEGPAMEPFAVAGWQLLTALFSLGPAQFAPHLVQFLMLWTESLDTSSSSDNALSACLFALIALLRNSDANTYAVLQRSVSALLLPYKDKFQISERTAQCQTAFFQLFCELGKTKWMEATVLVHMPLALYHVLLASKDTCTSLLQVGGMLDSSDDVLSEAGAVESDSAAAPAEFEYMTSCGLHALVGRRARMRKGLAQRVKIAMHGGAYSEVALSNADPRTVPSPRKCALVDSAVCVIATSFAHGPAKLKLQILTSLQAKYSATAHTTYKDINLASALLACVRLTTLQQQQQQDSKPEAHTWQQAFFNLAWPFMRHNDARVRRAMAQAISQFALKLCTADFFLQVKSQLELALNDPNAEPAFAAGALLCAIKLDREDMGPTILTGCTKNAALSSTTWALHCWIAFCNHTAAGQTRYITPTMQMLSSALFSPAAPQQVLLARLLLAVANMLNAEMMEPTRQRTVCTLISVWMWLISLPKQEEETKDACVQFLDRLYYFHSPQVKQRALFAQFLFDCLQNKSCNAVFTTALPCFLRLCEDEVSSTGGSAEFSISHVPLIFEALERFGRSFIRPGAAAVVHKFLGPFPLRRAWQQLEMSGACASPLQYSKHKFFYPPEVEEDACKVLSEIIRISSDATLVEFAAYLKLVVGNREIRWQTRLVALEAMNQVIIQAGVQLLPQLDSLITSVCQISTLSVGDFDVHTVQTRGLACLSSLVTVFAGESDPQDASLPLLRQYEAQLNATLRPGLRNHIQADLSEEAGELVSLLLISSISTSAKRLISQLDEEEENEAFVDDVSQVGFRLGRCSAFARLAIASFSTRDVGSTSTALRPDALDRIRASLPPSLVSKLCRFWLRITRDYFVLTQSKQLAVPKRHPDATYQTGKTGDDVEQLLPLYSQSWPICALAAAYCVDGPSWPTASSASLLVLACARAISTEDDPTKAIQTLEILRQKKSWNSTEVDLSAIYSALLARAKRAFLHRKLALRDACLKCLEVFLSLHNSPPGSFSEKEWALLFTQILQCLPSAESKMKTLLRFHLVPKLPSTLTEVFLTSAAFQASQQQRGSEEQLVDCAKVFIEVNRNATTAAAAVAFQFVLATPNTTTNAMQLFAFWVAVGCAPKLTEQQHSELVSRMLNEEGGASKPLLQALASLLKQDDKKDIASYYLERVWQALVWQHPDQWLVDADRFPLVCLLQIMLPPTSPLNKPGDLLDLFFQDTDRESRRKTWAQFLTQLAQVNKPAFQAYLATTPAERKLVLRDFMTS